MSFFARQPKLVIAGLLAALAFVHVALALRLLPSLREGYQDFTTLYTAGKLVRSGQGHSLYRLPSQYQAGQEFAPSVQLRRQALPYIRPPFEALLLAPLTLMSYFSAYLLWTALNAAMLVFALLLLKARFPELENIALALLFLAAAAYWPIAFGLIQGQDAGLLLLICVAALVSLADGSDKRAGAFLALGLFKFHLVVPLLVLLAIRRWRLLLGFVPVAALLGAISIAIVGVQGAVEYMRLLLRVENGSLGMVNVRNMPNLHGLIDCLPGIHDMSGLSFLLVAGSSLAIFALTARRMAIKSDSILHSFALASVATLLISYHDFGYDLTLLFPAVLLLACESTKPDSRHQWIPKLLVLCFFLPLGMLLHIRLEQSCWFAVVMVGLWWVLLGDTRLHSHPDQCAA